MNHKPPSFFWQGLLILLPAALLAAAGLYALRRDRLLAEHEAAESARKAASELIQHVLPEVFSFVAPSSEATERYRTQAYSPEEEPLYGWANAPMGGIGLCVDGQGGLIYPPPQQLLPEPQPLDLSVLDRAQLEAWSVLQDAVWKEPRSSDRVFLALDDLLATQVPDRYAAAAHYQAGVRAARAGQFLKAREAFELVRTRYATHRGETGLPLKILAELHLLRLATQAPGSRPVNPAWLNGVFAGALQQPSVLSPWLVAQVEAVLEQADPSVAAGQGPLATWHQVQQLHAQARSFHRALSNASPTLAGQGSPAPLLSWLEWDECSWLVARADAAGGSAWYLGRPESNAVWLAHQALAGLNLPAYLGAQITVAGRPLLTVDSNALVLASLSEGPGPGSPDSELSVSISLVDPVALYERQRLRTRWFGALILLSLGAVFAGFLTAWRAFQNQQQLNELKTNFVSSVSHELRAPLSSLRLMAEELDDAGAPAAGKLRQYHRFMVQECRRLSALVDNVLDFARLEQGRKRFEFEPMDLKALVVTTIKTMEVYGAEKGVQLRVQVPGEPLEIEADGQALQQVLVNLLDNAIKHSPAGAQVTVGLDRPDSAEPLPGMVRMWVEDQGPGIPPADHRHIFERFYRRGSELRRETQGVGLGLSIARSIVEAHHGQISVRSAEGKGSRFTVALPSRVNQAYECNASADPGHRR
jgi:signal transduction histidine kinase